MTQLTNSKVLKIILIGWIIVVTGYLSHTEVNCRSRDFWGHVDHTEYIVNQHKLPKPHEGWETYQPPLYYLIISFFSPPLFDLNKDARMHLGRIVSVTFGLLALWLMIRFLQELNFDPLVQLLVLSFIATTPKFIYIFSTYNNDSLATFLSIAIVIISYKLYHKWSKQLALCLLAATTAALYSKITVVLCIVTIFLICCKDLIKGKLPNKLQLNIVRIFVLSAILLLPWLVLHNYRHTGKFLPTNVDSAISQKFTFTHFKTLVGIVLRIPQLQHYPKEFTDYTHEWDEPWIRPTWGQHFPSTKRYDYLTYTFIISILDEFIHSKPHVNVFWTILWAHLIAHLLGLKEVFKTNINKLSAFAIFSAHLGTIITMLPGMIFTSVPNVDYRYIAWTWLPWAILFSSALAKKDIWSFILKSVIVIGIVLQVYTLFVIEGCWSE